MKQQDQFKSSAVVHFTPKSIHNSATYTSGVYHNLHMIAMCMEFDPKQLHKLPYRLYTQLTMQGFKQKGHYQIQIPHLVKLKQYDCKKNQKQEPDADCLTPCMGDYATESACASTMLVDTSTQLRAGMYVCSLDLYLSNPHWRLEDVEFNNDTLEWDLDGVFRRIPPNQPTECEATLAMNVLRYTGPLPKPTVSTPLTSFLYAWLPTEQLQRARGEFNKYFLESG